MIKRIISADNSRLRLVRKLSLKKHRDREGLFLIEGVNLTDEAFKRNAPVRFVIVSEDRADIADSLEAMSHGRAEICTVSRQLFEELADAENGSGVIAVVGKETVGCTELRGRLEPDDNILILDRLQDPGNIGTIIRTAVAAGYRAVFAVKGTADIYSPKVLRATAGMVFDIPTVYFADAGSLAAEVKLLGKRLAVTVPAGGTPYYDVDLTSGVALVVGNEGNGISDEMLALADERITIPMRGDVESLNAAISAAVLMYEAVRGTRQKGAENG